MKVFLVSSLVLFFVSGDPVGAVVMGGIVWLFWRMAGGTDTDPDRAYGEVDSDGDFGN